MADRQPLPLPLVLIHLLAPNYQGLQAAEMWEVLTPKPAYSTVQSALRQLCDQHIARRVAPGLYTLTIAFRTSGLVDVLTSSPGDPHA